MNPQVDPHPDWKPNPAWQNLPLVSAQEHRNSMRNVAVAVTIITSRHEARQAGLTATAVVSVTAEPPRLAVFINKNVVAADIIMQSGALCVNVLSRHQQQVAEAFAGMIKDVHGDARFGYGRWGAMVTAAPCLEDALVNFDCRVVKRYDESTHHVFVCEVLATQGDSSQEALIYLNGAFKQVMY